MATKNKVGRPRKNEINERFSLVITTEKLSENLKYEERKTGLNKSVIINNRLIKSYETNPAND